MNFADNAEKKVHDDLYTRHLELGSPPEICEQVADHFVLARRKALAARPEPSALAVALAPEPDDDDPNREPTDGVHVGVAPSFPPPGMA